MKPTGFSKTQARAFALAAAQALCFLATPCYAAPPQTTADAREEGRTRFTRGLDFYHEGNFHAALAEFRAAYEAAPSPRILYNLGQTLFQLKAYAEALSALEQVSLEGRSKLSDEQAKALDPDIATLRQRVHTLSLITNLEAANVQVTVDDETRAPVSGTLRLSAGRRKISVTASGYQTETRVLDVAGSAKSELRLELKPIATPEAKAAASTPKTAASPAPVQAPAPRAPSQVPFYLGLGLTGALGAGTIVFSALAASKYSNWKDAAAQPNPNRTTLEAARSGARSFALVADIGAGLTLVSAITTAVLFATSRGDPEPPKPRAALPQVHVGLGSAGLEGSF
jgi:Anaphase-promoting complex, cyclosome, subunit 3